MADILDVGRRAELRDLAGTVNTVEDARRIIETEKLKADPGDNKSVFYYGVGHDGAKELSSREGYVKLEQTERGYFLEQVTGKLTTEGKIPRGSDENKALFGDRGNGPGSTSPEGLEGGALRPGRAGLRA